MEITGQCLNYVRQISLFSDSLLLNPADALDGSEVATGTAIVF